MLKKSFVRPRRFILIPAAPAYSLIPTRTRLGYPRPALIRRLPAAVQYTHRKRGEHRGAHPLEWIVIFWDGWEGHYRTDGEYRPG